MLQTHHLFSFPSSLWFFVNLGTTRVVSFPLIWIYESHDMCVKLKENYFADVKQTLFLTRKDTCSDPCCLCCYPISILIRRQYIDNHNTKHVYIIVNHYMARCRIYPDLPCVLRVGVLEFSQMFRCGLCSEELVWQTQIKIEQIRKKNKQRRGGWKK